MVDLDLLEPNVVEILDLVLVHGTVERETERIVGHAASSRTDTVGDNGVVTGAVLHLRRAVRRDVSQQDERHTALTTCRIKFILLYVSTFILKQ